MQQQAKHTQGFQAKPMFLGAVEKPRKIVSGTFGSLTMSSTERDELLYQYFWTEHYLSVILLVVLQEQ